MIIKATKKPVTVEAIQLTEDSESIRQVYSFMGKSIPSGVEKLEIETLEGVMTANIGDYIIKGVNGEFYPCKPDIFEKTYTISK